MTPEDGRTTAEPRHRSMLMLGCVALANPLALYAWTGTNMRYTGNHYCYAGLCRKLGFWDTIRSTYLATSPFNGNRYSLTLFSGLVGMVGPAASAALPALAIGTGVAGLTFGFGAAARAFSLQISPLERLLAAEGIVFYTLALSPELAQSLYWRSAMLPYFLPLVLLVLLGGIVLDQARQRRPPRLWLGSTFALALLAGGFSETAAALQFAALALALISILSARRGGGRRPRLYRVRLGQAVSRHGLSAGQASAHPRRPPMPPLAKRAPAVGITHSGARAGLSPMMPSAVLRTAEGRRMRSRSPSGSQTRDPA